MTEAIIAVVFVAVVAFAWRAVNKAQTAAARSKAAETRERAFRIVVEAEKKAQDSTGDELVEAFEEHMKKRRGNSGQPN